MFQEPEFPTEDQHPLWLQGLEKKKRGPLPWDVLVMLSSPSSAEAQSAHLSGLMGPKDLAPVQEDAHLALMQVHSLSFF